MRERFEKFRQVQLCESMEFAKLPVGQKFATEEYFLEKMDPASALILDVLAGSPWMLGKRRYFSPQAKICEASLPGSSPIGACGI